MDNVNRLRVGMFAPDFVLKDSEGKKVSLSDFQGRKNLLILFCEGRRNKFYLDWLDELNDLYEHLQQKDTEVLLLTQDERWISHKIKQKKKIRFPILKNEKCSAFDPPALSVSQQYGVHASHPEGKYVYPAIFFVDKLGIVRYRKVCVQPDEKPDLKELLSELDRLG